MTFKLNDTEQDQYESLLNAIRSGSSFLELVVASGLKPSVDFIGADFSYCDLSNESFSGFDFTGVDFTGADLRNSSFVGAQIGSAIFEGALLEGVVWGGDQDGQHESDASEAVHIGRRSENLSIGARPINRARRISYNLDESGLIADAVRLQEGDMGRGGALLVETGRHTGRSPRDRFIVRDGAVDRSEVWWDNLQEMSQESFDVLKDDVINYLKDREINVQYLCVGKNLQNELRFRCVTELAWHALFLRHVLQRPEIAKLDGFREDFTVICCPGFRADPNRHGCRSQTVIATSFSQKMIIICDTPYSGDIQKSILSVMMFVYPELGILPMHCAANYGANNIDDVAIFLGLSGTGKTTLSNDPRRTLLGDDGHAWCAEGIFTFDGGCQAKTLGLRPESDPGIYAATSMFGTVIENMMYNSETKELDFDDESLTQNMRAIFPFDYIPNASTSVVAGHPKHILMLTCDAFGVMPPIAKLTVEQAVFHFLSGFTAKVAGTEKGLVSAQATFSSCFGAPFMIYRPEVYGRMLEERLKQYEPSCWLVNTGWTGGRFGEGSRMPVSATRSLLTAIFDGTLDRGEYYTDAVFGFRVPKSCPGVPDVLLSPKKTWEDPEDYEKQAGELLKMFSDNFSQFSLNVDWPLLRESGLRIR